MDLKTYVSSVLQQAVQGVREAQSTEDGELINPEVAEVRSGVYGDHRLIHTRNNDVVSMIEFDVAVSIEGDGDEQRLLIPGAAGDGTTSQAAESQATSRIRFTIPIELPRPF